MAENIARYIEGLEQELQFAEARKDADQAKAVKAEIASAKRRLKKAETAVVEPEETPEGESDNSEKVVAQPAETPEGTSGGIVCPDCGKTFKNAGGLASHQRAKHEAS